MLSVRQFCEATAVELYDPAIRWNRRAYGYLRAGNRCKEFSEKILILAGKLDRFYNDLNILLRLLTEEHKFIFIRAVMGSGQKIIYPLQYGLNLESIIKAGLKLKCIDWNYQVQKCPFYIWLYKDHIIREYCRIHHTEQAEKYADWWYRLYQNVGKCEFENSTYMMLVLSNYIGKECPVAGIKDWVIMNEIDHHKHHPGIICLSSNDWIDDRFDTTVEQILAEDWLIDPFSFMISEQIWTHPDTIYNLVFYLIKMVKYNQVYMFYEKPNFWKAHILRRLSDWIATYQTSAIYTAEILFLNDSTACGRASQLSAENDPTKYRLWTKYRDRFLSYDLNKNVL